VAVAAGLPLRWFFKTDKGRFKRMDAAAEDELEKKAVAGGIASLKSNLGTKTTYSIDLKAMVQTNTRTDPRTSAKRHESRPATARCA
jgi:hypothetical protein